MQMKMALAKHWKEYLMDGALLGIFLIAACIFAVLLEHPGSPVWQSLMSQSDLRRAIFSAAMGLTAVALICSPWGQQSGGHMNPAMTLAYFALGKMSGWDATFFATLQLFGAIVGISAANMLLGLPLQHAAINYIVTRPLPNGEVSAFIAEFAISSILMLAVLVFSNAPALRSLTPIAAGALIALFVYYARPISGMSMNPARSVASAYCSGEWDSLWIYVVAPTAGMLAVSLLFRSLGRGAQCAKLCHTDHYQCMFRCRINQLQTISAVRE